MSPLAVLLALLAATLLVRRLLGRLTSGADWLALAAGAALAAQLATRPRLLLLPVYLVTGGACLLALARLARPRAPVVPRPRSRKRAAWRVASTLLALLLVALSVSAETLAAPLVNDSNHIFLGRDGSVDYSAHGWADGFRRMHERLRRDYAFGDWKRVPWDSLYAAYAPRVAAAERARDRRAYFLAVREYVWSIPDGHLGVDLEGDAVRREHIQGGYGLAVLRLDDGRTIAHVVLPDGPAARAGMRWGAELVSWNGLPVDSALRATPLTWHSAPPATEEGRTRARLALLPRALVGTAARIGFRNAGDTIVREAGLVARADSFEAMLRGGQGDRSSLRRPPVTWRLLPDGIGYVRIALEFPTLGGLRPDLEVRRAIRDFVRRDVRGVVLDIRGNGGGADRLVPLFVGYFFDRPSFYEHPAFHDERTGRVVIDSGESLVIRPESPHFAGPVVAIIDGRCVSSCEGIAMAVRRLPRGHVVGWQSTWGSFGMSGASIRLPAGVSVSYPNGQSVDSSGTVQLDTDWRLEGAVSPDVRPPLTWEAARAAYLEGRDVLLEEARRVIAREAGPRPS